MNVNDVYACYPSLTPVRGELNDDEAQSAIRGIAVFKRDLQEWARHDLAANNHKTIKAEITDQGSYLIYLK